MSDCQRCKYKNSRCFCPKDRECMAFEKEIHKVEHIFKFETDEDWIPGEAACWTNCPFAFMIKLGNYCVCLDGNIKCPFANNTKSEIRGVYDE